MLTTPLSVVAGIVFGDYTVNSGWFNSEIMLYMAFVAVANYTQNNMELGYAIKFQRIILLVLTGVFGIWGFNDRRFFYQSHDGGKRLFVSADPMGWTSVI